MSTPDKPNGQHVDSQIDYRQRLAGKKTRTVLRNFQPIGAAAPPRTVVPKPPKATPVMRTAQVNALADKLIAMPKDKAAKEIRALRETDRDLYKEVRTRIELLQKAKTAGDSISLTPVPDAETTERTAMSMSRMANGPQAPRTS